MLRRINGKNKIKKYNSIEVKEILYLSETNLHTNICVNLFITTCLLGCCVLKKYIGKRNFQHLSSGGNEGKKSLNDVYIIRPRFVSRSYRPDNYLEKLIP